MTAISIVGNLANDPELKFTNNGKAVASFTVISSKSIKKEDGSWENTDVTPWNIKCWNKLAENVSDSLKKGTGVIVQGTATWESWEDKTSGEKRGRMVVTAFSVGVDLKRHSVSVADVWRSDSSASTNIDDDPWASPAIGSGKAPADDFPPF